jgi:hypothetical protein
MAFKDNQRSADVQAHSGGVEQPGVFAHPISEVVEPLLPCRAALLVYCVLQYVPETGAECAYQNNHGTAI